MLIIFSPFSFIFMFVYLLLMVLLFTINEFFSFWVVIEFIMLLFIGVSFTVFVNSLSSLITFFFIQSVSSFLIFVSFLWSSPTLFTISLLLNLGIFPFLYWFISVVNVFPNSIFFISSTFHNIPVFLIIFQFSFLLYINLLLISILFTCGVVSFLMFTTLDLRFLLVSSSVGNNSWLVLSQLSGFDSIFIFFSIYFLLFGLTLAFQGHAITPVKNSLFMLLLLSGFPPSPLFLGKLLVILNLAPLDFSFFLIFFLVLSVVMSVSYIVYLFSFFVFNFSN